MPLSKPTITYLAASKDKPEQVVFDDFHIAEEYDLMKEYFYEIDRRGGYLPDGTQVLWAYFETMFTHDRTYWVNRDLTAPLRAFPFDGFSLYEQKRLKLEAKQAVVVESMPIKTGRVPMGKKTGITRRRQV
jgi:hypothetical protein